MRNQKKPANKVHVVWIQARPKELWLLLYCYTDYEQARTFVHQQRSIARNNKMYVSQHRHIPKWKIVSYAQPKEVEK